MDALDAVTHALPASVERLRRRFWRDPEFRRICEGYRDATEAATRFEAADTARAQEYREVAAELLVEAGAMIAAERL